LITKSSNPKQAQGIKKVPFHVIPSNVVAEVGLALLEGALKYGSYNYRAIGVRSSTYYDACLRHLSAWFNGEDIDPETVSYDEAGQPIQGSGIHHITKAMACLVVLRDSQMYGNINDDRPPRMPDGWQQELNKKAEELIKKYPNPKEPYTQLGTL
jgi:hypothetical protein